MEEEAVRARLVQEAEAEKAEEAEEAEEAEDAEEAVGVDFGRRLRGSGGSSPESTRRGQSTERRQGA